jgi:hypothetical protein
MPAECGGGVSQSGPLAPAAEASPHLCRSLKKENWKSQPERKRELLTQAKKYSRRKREQKKTGNKARR